MRDAADAESPESPRDSSQGMKWSPNRSAPKAADRKPVTVTPTCKVARSRLGLLATAATFAPRLPRVAICLIWLSRRETRAISAATKMAPRTIRAAIRPMEVKSELLGLGSMM